MFIDARELHGPSDSDFDVCVAGAGAAGISLALELCARGISVGLLEGGGFEPPDEDELDLYAGEIGFKPYPLALSRLRYFGGSTGHWGGWCRPLDAIDFERRPGWPLSGWPIRRADLEPHYSRALELCEIPSGDFAPGSALAGRPTSTLELPQSSGFVTKIFRFSPPTRFGSRYRGRIGEEERIHAFLHANAIGLERSGGRVDALSAVTLAGQRIRIRAEHFVLAMGGIENPRFLLNELERGSVGIGNASGMLGACFMDHFALRPGYAILPADLDYLRSHGAGGEVMPVLSMSDEALREHGLRNFCALFQPEAPTLTVPPAFLSNPAVVGANAAREAQTYGLQFLCEPSPNPASRVELTDARDALGQRRARVDWRITPEDYASVMAVTERLAVTLGASRRGRLRRISGDTPEFRHGASGSMHHMGTTRISEDPRQGVVDADCRVHGSENLYVAGSSVFPSAGFSNPTLTIVALAVRLAEHLESLG